ncbi:hypothetical protein ACSXCI_15820 (plasmid) [Clostridium perfringens]
MQFIIGDKLFDTDKAELVCEFEVFKGYGVRKIEKTLYRTKKGNWFIVDEYSNCSIITENKARELLIELNDIENYKKYFGELEEA